MAIRAETFGQCIDAIGMIDVTWDQGTVAGQSDDTVEAQLKAALPALTALGITLAITGVVLSWIICGIGVVIAVVAIVRWIRQTREEMAELPLEH